MTLLATPEALRTPHLSDATFDALVAVIATAEPIPQPLGPIPAANALRTELPNLTVLSSGERHVLQEWLDRIVTAHPSDPWRSLGRFVARRPRT